MINKAKVFKGLLWGTTAAGITTLLTMGTVGFAKTLFLEEEIKNNKDSDGVWNKITDGLLMKVNQLTKFKNDIEERLDKALQQLEIKYSQILSIEEGISEIKEEFNQKSLLLQSQIINAMELMLKVESSNLNTLVELKKAIFGSSLSSSRQ